MKEYKFHTVANIMPMMNELEFNSLKDDISKNGLREPIWLFNDEIIDGRNRYLACKSIGIAPHFKTFNGDESELISFVLSLNLHRRHLSTTQKACLSVNIMPDLERKNELTRKKKISASRSGEPSGNLPPTKKSRAIASELFGVSERYIQDAKSIKAKSEPLFNQMLNGELSIQDAMKLLNKAEFKTVAILPPTDEPNITVKFTKQDITRADKMIQMLNISKDKALNFIKAEKIERANKQTTNRTTTSISTKRAKIYFEIPESEKMKLKSIADEMKISLTELIKRSIDNIKR